MSEGLQIKAKTWGWPRWLLTRWLEGRKINIFKIFSWKELKLKALHESRPTEWEFYPGLGIGPGFSGPGRPGFPGFGPVFGLRIWKSGFRVEFRVALRVPGPGEKPGYKLCFLTLKYKNLMIVEGIFWDSQLHYVRLQWQLADRMVKVETNLFPNCWF